MILGCSGIEPRLAPGLARPVAPELDAVVQAERTVVPELDRGRDQAEATPVRRAWNAPDEVFCRVDRDRLFEGEPALEWRRLAARPGPDLREPRTGGEIGVRLGFADRLDRAAQPDLAHQRLPMKYQGGLRAYLQLAALAAVEVGVEHEPPLVEVLQKHHPHIRQAIRIDRGKR